MSTYAVVNPATGETIKEYPEIGDDELRGGLPPGDRPSDGPGHLHRRRHQGRHQLRAPTQV